MAATSRKPGRGLHVTEPGHVQLALAHHRDEDVERLLGDPVDLLDVEQRPVPQRLDQRAVDEDVGAVALGQHPGRVEVADEAGRRQLGVALDEGEADAELVGDGPEQRRLPGAGRPLEQDVAAGGEGRDDDLQLATRGRRPGGAAGRAGRPRRARSVEDDHAADVLAVAHVLVALVDLVERVGAA